MEESTAGAGGGKGDARTTSFFPQNFASRHQRTSTSNPHMSVSDMCEIRLVAHSTFQRSPFEKSRHRTWPTCIPHLSVSDSCGIELTRSGPPAPCVLRKTGNPWGQNKSGASTRNMTSLPRLRLISLFCIILFFSSTFISRVGAPPRGLAH